MQRTAAHGAPIQLELIGRRVDVAVSGSRANTLERLIAGAWDRCLAQDPAAPPAAVVEVVLDHHPAVVKAARERGLLAGHDELPLMSSLSSTLTKKAIELGHGRLLMLHACALADPSTGNTVVLVARSGTGKTTAATTLGREMAYLTDETAAISDGDMVVPYPKPLSILDDGQPPKLQISPSDLGMLPAPPHSKVTAVALLHRASECTTPSIERVPTLEALAAIAEQSSAIQLLPRPLHLIAGLLNRTGGLKRISYREVADAAPLIKNLAAGGVR